MGIEAAVLQMGEPGVMNELTWSACHKRLTRLIAAWRCGILTSSEFLMEFRSLDSEFSDSQGDRDVAVILASQTRSDLLADFLIVLVSQSTASTEYGSTSTESRLVADAKQGILARLVDSAALIGNAVEKESEWFLVALLAQYLKGEQSRQTLNTLGWAMFERGMLEWSAGSAAQFWTSERAMSGDLLLANVLADARLAMYPETQLQIATEPGSGVRAWSAASAGQIVGLAHSVAEQSDDDYAESGHLLCSAAIALWQRGYSESAESVSMLVNGPLLGEPANRCIPLLAGLDLRLGHGDRARQRALEYEAVARDLGRWDSWVSEQQQMLVTWVLAETTTSTAERLALCSQLPTERARRHSSYGPIGCRAATLRAHAYLVLGDTVGAIEATRAANAYRGTHLRLHFGCDWQVKALAEGMDRPHARPTDPASETSDCPRLPSSWP